MHVFVSHSSKDAAIANEYVEALEAAGFKAWVAPRDLLAGTDYAQMISDAIRNASTFLLLCSETSLSSPDVRNEFELAKRRGVNVIPVRLAGSPDPLDNVAWEYHLLRLQIVQGVDPAGTISKIHPSLAASASQEPVQPAAPAERSKDESAETTVSRTPESERRLFEVWDQASRTIVRILDIHQLLPRQKLADGGGLRWFYLDEKDGTYASIEFIPGNLGSPDQSPLWVAIPDEGNAGASDVQTRLRNATHKPLIKQAHNSIRIPVPYAADGPLAGAVDQAVSFLVELRNQAIP